MLTNDTLIGDIYPFLKDLSPENKTQDFSLLLRAWINEKCAPDLLPIEESFLENWFKDLEQQVIFLFYAYI